MYMLTKLNASHETDPLNCIRERMHSWGSFLLLFTKWKKLLPLSRTFFYQNWTIKVICHKNRGWMSWKLLCLCGLDDHVWGVHLLFPHIPPLWPARLQVITSKQEVKNIYHSIQSKKIYLIKFPWYGSLLESTASYLGCFLGWAATLHIKIYEVLISNLHDPPHDLKSCLC
jgi:hypothetical protein